MKARIEILMKQGISPEDAVRQVFREFGVEDWLQVNVAKVIVGTAQDALGKEAASTLSTAAILEALSNPWDGSGLTLSEKIHGASNVMLNDVISTLREQIRRNKTVKDTAQALYDGYKSGHVVREQELPQYLDELTRWTRRSRENLSQEELKDLQRSIRKVRYQADDLVDDRSTYNHFRTSLRELMDKLEHAREPSKAPYRRKAGTWPNGLPGRKGPGPGTMPSWPGTGKMKTWLPINGNWEAGIRRKTSATCTPMRTCTAWGREFSPRTR